MDFWDRKAPIKTLNLPENSRILVISDIHANLPYLIGVLKKAGFNSRDTLIIDGDFLEKGPKSLATLQFIMELSKVGNVYCVCGNCDDWAPIYDDDWHDDEHLLHYIMYKKCGLLWDMCNECGLDLFSLESFVQCKWIIKERFKEEWAFLAAMPFAIETENFIFAHASVDPDKPLKDHTASDLAVFETFLTSGRSFDKWVVVGHTPVVLYGENTVCANPIVDREKKIVSIDGGCVLKDDGQLNCLIIPNKFSDDFTFTAYDDFPEYLVLNDQQEGKSSYYIRWGDSQVRVLKRGEEFSRCRHVRTGYEMDILTKYLFTDNEYTDCNDCTDYILPLAHGDTVSLIESTSRGYFVKHNGVSGWYYGLLDKIGTED